METTPDVLCDNCGQVIVHSTFRGMGQWEPDYDRSDDPVVWRHANGYAACPTSFAKPAVPVIDAEHLRCQREWSENTFGPGARTLGVLDHIRKELVEIENAPTHLSEWIDVVILALDGAWRAGWEPQRIIDAIKAKQTKNEAREWPDWRMASPDRAIEHVRHPSDSQGQGSCVG